MRRRLPGLTLTALAVAAFVTLEAGRAASPGRPVPPPKPAWSPPPPPPAGPPRPWRFRAGVLAGLVVAALAIRVVRQLLWGDGIVARGWLPVLVSHTTVLWALPALPCAFGVAGLLLYRRPGPRPDTPCPHLVCFRVVSRGQNAAALRATVANVRAQLLALPLFPYVIEVVTDEAVPLPAGRDLRHLVVPRSYQTTNGSRYKARALQYAVERSALPDDAWVFHLDEETHLTPSVVRGIRDAVAEEEASGAHRIGQGAILYHRHLGRHPFLTLADMVRTGDDLGRFHVQHRLGRTVFGLHGSFILVRNSVERRCDFDFGPEGSITEDAFWAVRQMALGTRSRWVDGFVVEQSTQSVADFVKQRRRWFAGLLRVVLYADTTLWLRTALAAFVALWALSWVGVATTLANLALGLRTPPVVAALGDFSLATFVVTYVVGLHVNLRERGGVPWPRRAALYALQVLLVPAFATLEAAGVVAALVRPERGFHVVRKSAAAPAGGMLPSSSRVVHRPVPPRSKRLPTVARTTQPPGRTPCRTPTTSAPTRPRTARSGT